MLVRGSFRSVITVCDEAHSSKCFERMSESSGFFELKVGIGLKINSVRDLKQLKLEIVTEIQD